MIVHGIEAGVAQAAFSMKARSGPDFTCPLRLTLPPSTKTLISLDLALLLQAVLDQRVGVFRIGREV